MKCSPSWLFLAGLGLSASSAACGGGRQTAAWDAGVDAATDAPDAAAPDDELATYVPPAWDPSSAVRLVVLGDSISAGWVASSGALSYPQLLAVNDDSTWPAMASRDLASLTGAAVTVIDESVPGAVTEDVLDDQLVQLDELAPFSGHTIVVMTVGGNDIGQFLSSNSAPEILNGIDAELERIAENVGLVHDWFDATRAPDGVSLVVATVYDPTDGTASGGVDGETCIDLGGFAAFLNQWSVQGRDLFVSKAQGRGFAVADAYGYFLGHGYDHANAANPNYRAEDPTLWFGDCVHPNDLGHHELRRLMFSVIDPSFEL